MAVNLVARRLKEFRFIIGFACGDRRRLHHPNAHAFLSTRVNIARHLQSVLRIGGVQTAAVFMLKALLATHKDFPQGPFFEGGG